MVSLHRVNPSKQQKGDMYGQKYNLANLQHNKKKIQFWNAVLFTKKLKLWNACAHHKIAKRNASDKDIYIQKQTN